LKPEVTLNRVRWLALAIMGMLCLGCATGTIVRDATPPKEVRDAQAKAVEETLVVPTAELQKTAAEVKEAGAPQEGAAGTKTAEDLFSEYRIGSNDVLGFRFFDDDTLSSQVVVRYDGCISLPLIPDVKVAGATRQEAVDALKKAYSAFFQEPQLSLSVVATNSKTFSVMGDITMPGEYPYLRPMSLIDCINAAGGMRIYQRGGDSYVGAQGQLVKALIIRHSADQRDVIERDLRGFGKMGPHASETPVFPGDIVYVPESVNLVYLLGEVRGPGVFALSEGMTLLQLLARAGGFNESTARLHQVVLMREESNTKSKIMLVNVRQIMKTGQDILVVPGDIIYLPRKPLTNLGEFVSRFTGTVSPVLNLYRQAWDTYYTKKQFDMMFSDVPGTGTGSNLLAIQQALRNIAAFSGITAP
jgi:polysaccharide export outer membrane protein